MSHHPLAGTKVTPDQLCNIDDLVSFYFIKKPNPSQSEQLVRFGTSGHRGTSLDGTFTESHILAIVQAVCDYRRDVSITGPLFLGKDTHALSDPAEKTAIEVLAANGVQVKIDKDMGFTPTPVISHSILTHNDSGAKDKADGIVITPSHNPPDNGGIKYNPPHGGPADKDITSEIADRANKSLKENLKEVKRIPLDSALDSDTIERFDYRDNYIQDLKDVIDFECIKRARIKIGADALGGAGLAYWHPIATHYGLDIDVLNNHYDPTFSFMHLDHDGKIRMDCSSKDAMAGLIDLKENYAVAFGNDPDFDRHGIVTPSAGLLNPNHFLAVAIWYLFQNRPDWSERTAIGKTLVSSSMIDRVAQSLGREIKEVPVGFKWFVDGLHSGELAFGGEESAGATFLRKDGTVWSTDKDGIIMSLLAAEILAKTGKDPGVVYNDLTRALGNPVYQRIDAPATLEEKTRLDNLSEDMIDASTLAGEPIQKILTHAPANDEPIGGLKVITENGWFAARPSGTEDIYKIYAESFLGRDHLSAIQKEAKDIVHKALHS